MGEEKENKKGGYWWRVVREAEISGCGSEGPRTLSTSSGFSGSTKRFRRSDSDILGAISLDRPTEERIMNATKGRPFCWKREREGEKETLADTHKIRQDT